ncbi:hypothetical protein RDWZM_002416 [Blomia tropicalis]|uniref:SKI/SNO/DAC domain-containing protein n=1 Tax=Blomia tropicalis TaxID=40697 RepID=A0A9Q0RS71_BLOTA|nr:hypothetical protein RDWZM_002416 [Blomia tropicalis]
MSQLSASPPPPPPRTTIGNVSNNSSNNTNNNYHHLSSPASTISDDDDSNHSIPNDLRTSQKSRHHGGFGAYASFYSPPQSHTNSTLGGGHSASSHGQPQYVATNECRLIDYRGARIAAFLAANRQGEYLLCLPQAFELFLKHLVGGLHTVYTKLKRLDIVPIVCNVEQVRILRGLGAIQPGVNRCKLLSTHDFDVLYKDCTTAREDENERARGIRLQASPIQVKRHRPDRKMTVVL